MSNNKMLIDASHPEETRVVVLRGNRIEEFDFESASKKPLRGNIYLAKVTRVEPSLQAAFVEYGGNRHGFLAFSEIHPDYYQIPVADRMALLEEEAREQQAEADEEDARPTRRSNRRRRGPTRARRADAGDDRIAAEVAPQDVSGAHDPASQEVGQDGGQEAGREAGREAGFDEQAATDDAGLTGPAPHDPEALAASPAESLAGPSGDHRPGAVDPDAGDEPGSHDTPSLRAAGEPAPDEATNGAGQREPERDEPENDVSARAGDAQYDDLRNDAVEVGEDDERFHDEEGDGVRDDGRDDGQDDGEGAEEDDAASVEQLGGDVEEDLPRSARRSRKQYKIQEVIKRRQIMLIQVVKEERGNKGAALTTYLSLAGRYSVLMPNTARGGGISRKITDTDDRRRLKEIAQELDVPEGMGVILRTAGASRTKQEVRRDFEYLLRLWESVREMTLRSAAPTLVYEEGSLIKRSIRDLYGRDVDEVVVAGEEGYREAKDFMRMLMPSHAKNIRIWREPQPIFAKSGVEQQLDALFSATVTMKSGGYIVINQTEALVAIDVNSGRSTREHNIEDTALRTNLEAADEIARQLRLRDLAGLIVIDFIDMEEHRNNRAVERRLKDALKSDRARIQIGRISHFGLLEMSRQRMRTGVLEGSSVVCPHCQGSGSVRSTASIALHVLRLVEDALIRSNAYNLVVRTRSEVALYMLNQKRMHLADLEHRFGVTLTILADDHLIGTAYHVIERGDPATPPLVTPTHLKQVTYAGGLDEDEPLDDVEDEAVAVEAADEAEAPPTGDDGNGAATGELAGDDAGDSLTDEPRRRRRRRRGRDRAASGISADAPQPPDDGFAAFGYIQAQPDVELAPILPGEASAQGAEPALPAGDESAEAGNGDEDVQARGSRRRRGFRRRGRGRQNGETTAEGAQSEGEDPAADEPRRGAWVRTSDDDAQERVAFAQDSERDSVQSPFSQETDAPAASDAVTAQIGGATADVVEETAAPDQMTPPNGAPIETEPATQEQSLTVATSAAEMSTAESPPETPYPEQMAEQIGEQISGPASREEHEHTPEREQAEDLQSSAPAAQADVLPEASPPPVKRTGWWQRVRRE